MWPPSRPLGRPDSGHRRERGQVLNLLIEPTHASIQDLTPISVARQVALLAGFDPA